MVKKPKSDPNATTIALLERLKAIGVKAFEGHGLKVAFRERAAEEPPAASKPTKHAPPSRGRMPDDDEPSGDIP